jgi:hypothetical protein
VQQQQRAAAEPTAIKDMVCRTRVPHVPLTLYGEESWLKAAIREAHTQVPAQQMTCNCTTASFC